MSNKPLLMEVPAWDMHPFAQRLSVALTALRVQGIITSAEYYRAIKRLDKKWEQQNETND